MTRPLIILTRPLTAAEIRAETLTIQAAIGIATERRERPGR